MKQSVQWKNKLFFGDNLNMLRHIADKSVDLIYLDPPFNSKANYNVLFKESSGQLSDAQITAFEDTWHWGQDSEDTYREIIQHGPKKLADLIQALRSFLGQNDMMAYLVMMAIRLVELRRVLSSTGSIFLHCDPTASHYLKMTMDSIFGIVNFQNEVVWSYKRYTARSGRYQRLHDIILFYTRSEKGIFNSLRIDYGPKSGTSDSHYKQGEDQRWYRWQKRKGKEPYKIYLSEGRRLGDVWEIPHINASAKERLGYPTQKPEALLERIIKASSNEGDLVLDPFCGCGTTVAVAERLKRRWIGIDITHLAITLMKNRLDTSFSPDELTPYEVIGAPVDHLSAKALAEQDRYQFEWWALGLIDARPAQDKKKGGDTGIDGYINFFDDNSDKAKKIVVQVKSGKSVNPGMIRDLEGVVERENAVIGVLITLYPPTRMMRQEALSSGSYEPEFLSSEHRASKIQILTIEELLKGASVKYPRLADVTFSKAPRKSKSKAPDQDSLL